MYAILCQHIQELQTSKNSPGFWPTLYVVVLLLLLLLLLGYYY